MAESLATGQARVGMEVPRQQSPLIPRAVISPVSPWSHTQLTSQQKGLQKTCMGWGVWAVNYSPRSPTCFSFCSPLPPQHASEKLTAGPATCCTGHMAEPSSFLSGLAMLGLGSSSGCASSQAVSAICWLLFPWPLWKHGKLNKAQPSYLASLTPTPHILLLKPYPEGWPKSSKTYEFPKREHYI